MSTRKRVYDAIDSERDFQEVNKANPDSHIVEDFNLGDAISAIHVKLDIARGRWYSGVIPHEKSMEELRKIAAICVQMGEKYGMPCRL